ARIAGDKNTAVDSGIACIHVASWLAAIGRPRFAHVDRVVVEYQVLCERIVLNTVRMTLWVVDAVLHKRVAYRDIRTTRAETVVMPANVNTDGRVILVVDSRTDEAAGSRSNRSVGDRVSREDAGIFVVYAVVDLSVCDYYVVRPNENVARHMPLVDNLVLR